MIHQIRKVMDEHRGKGLSTRELMEILLREVPGLGQVTCEEVAVWLEAIMQDIKSDMKRDSEQYDQELRDAGMAVPNDLKLFTSIMRPGEELGDAINRLRRKRKPGAKQQRAIELWDRYYADKIFTESGELVSLKDAFKRPRAASV